MFHTQQLRKSIIYNFLPSIILYYHRFRRRLLYFILFLLTSLCIWSYIPYHCEQLTGAYCQYNQSIPRSVIKDDDDDFDENVSLCSFDRIFACQLIKHRSLLYITSSRVGFVSELNNMLNAFAYSVATKRRFLIDGRQWNYGPFENYFNMNQSGFTPYLFVNEEFNSCIKRTFYSMVPDHYQNDRNNYIMVSRDNRGHFDLLNAVTKDYEQRKFKGLRSIRRKRQVAQFLWQHLFRRTIRTIINHFYKKHPSFNKDSYYYGMHVRRGDKLLHEDPRNLSVSDYVHGVKELATKLDNPSKDVNINSTPVSFNRTVFVASDDQQTVIEQLKEFYPQWNFVHLDYDDQWQHTISRSSSFNKSKGHDQDVFNQLSDERKRYETNMFLAELTILSEAHGVVCTFSSNICRFIQLLRKQNENTVLSLDIEWYPE